MRCNLGKMIWIDLSLHDIKTGYVCMLLQIYYLLLGVFQLGGTMDNGSINFQPRASRMYRKAR